MAEEGRSSSFGIPITPDSRVSLPLWRFIVVVVSIAVGVAAAVQGYSRLQDSIRVLGERIVAVDSKLAQYSPAAVRDTAREVCREELRTLVIYCPRSVRKGETVAPCRTAREDRDARQ